MLSDREIEFVTYKWIGVNAGYLGDFTYRKHRDFYYDYCLLENIDPDDYDGTTRNKFEHILKISPPNIKAKILKGVLEKFPQEDADFRTTAFKERMLEFIKRCETSKFVENKVFNTKVEAIEKALEDANIFIESNRPVSAVDRLHTGFHGYLIKICTERSIRIEANAPITNIFKEIRKKCDEFNTYENHSKKVKKILNSLSAIIDSINGIRNEGSIAHPNEKIISLETAVLYINTVRTILNFLESKLKKESV